MWFKKEVFFCFFGVFGVLGNLGRLMLRSFYGLGGYRVCRVDGGSLKYRIGSYEFFDYSVIWISYWIFEFYICFYVKMGIIILFW